jgi:hypothetical protein
MENRKKQYYILKQLQTTPKNTTKYNQLVQTAKQLRSDYRSLSVTNSDASLPRVCQSCIGSQLRKTNPCRGQGMDTPARQKRFICRLRKYLFAPEVWKSLTPAQRRIRMRDIANKELKSTGHPGIRMPPYDDKNGKENSKIRKKFKSRPTLNGVHYGSSNSVYLNPSSIDSDSPPANPGKVANTVYHEARHGEQTYLAAVYKARQLKKRYPKASRQGIENYLRARGIAPKVAKEAVDAPPRGHSKDPLFGREACAKTMWDNKFKKTKDKKSQWHAFQREKKDREEELKERQKELKELQDKSADQAAIDAAKKRVQDAQLAKKRHYYYGYRMYPNEVDSFQIGSDVERNYEKTECS